MPRVPKGQGITLEEGDFGFTFVIRHDDGRDLLIQTDWDYPGTASTFGWVPKKRRGCDHPGTDGTIDCRACGKTATEFISEAQDYLSSHIGKRVEDPGYFEYAENPRRARRKKAVKKTSRKKVHRNTEPAGYYFTNPDISILMDLLGVWAADTYLDGSPMETSTKEGTLFLVYTDRSHGNEIKKIWIPSSISNKLKDWKIENAKPTYQSPFETKNVKWNK